MNTTQIKTITTRAITIGEEIMNSITHGIGAGLSIAGLTLLVVLAVLSGNVRQVVSFSIYGASLIILYLASTLYHSFQQPEIKQTFKIIDHSAIYVLIAGTYTPFLLLGVPGVWGWVMFVFIWGVAILGIGFRKLFIYRFPQFAALTYILMGWVSVFMIKPLRANIALGGLMWLVAGGVVYTIGVIFYALKKIPYMHGVWHLFVLGGSICHYLAVLLYLVPVR